MNDPVAAALRECEEACPCLAGGEDGDGCDHDETCKLCGPSHTAIARYGEACREAGRDEVRAVVDTVVAAARLAGIEEGLRMYAWWRDGTEWVGTCGTTLKEAVAKVRDRLRNRAGK